MSIQVIKVSKDQADKVRLIDEGQFADLKAREIAPKDLTNSISAFANADGGDLYIGITNKTREWIGFSNVEAANGHLQIFEELFPLGTEFQYEFLQCDGYTGIVLHVQVDKTRKVICASNGVPYLRRGAQNLPQNTTEKVRRLELTKGVTSFETETLNIPKEVITESCIIENFVREVVPTTTADAWLRKQNLLVAEKPTVAGVLLFSEEPQATLPKHCGIKIYRYKSREKEGHRDLLADQPITVEGDLYTQISSAVQITKNITEKIPKISEDGAVESIYYPPETLHEILTNAVLHRDYSIKDDIHIRIFDDRVEVQSPGRLPANITPDNILDERFARNGAIVRILNKFPNPPNKDVGEGLNTAFIKMKELGLKNPVIKDLDNSVIVLIKHEPLTSPSEIIMSYLETNNQIKNAKAREITHIPTDFKMKGIFNKMEKAGLIEKVPGTNTSSTAWRKKGRTSPADGVQTDLFPTPE
jgi:ATP-dependent DNA helicase RecG